MPNGKPSHGASARLVPDEPLPPYSYVTGRFPHPTRDASGHSFGHVSHEPPPIDPQRWNESRTYLVGSDLFNHGYYWEAHETWEAVWKACGRRGTTADFLKGLIKLAAAGVRRHGARAGQLFREVRDKISGAKYLGLDVDELIAFAERLNRGIVLPEPSDRPVQIVFDLRLLSELGDATETS